MMPSISASAGGGGPSGSATGDQAASAYFDFTSNNAFSVGGSGKQTQNADTKGGGLSASDSGASTASGVSGISTTTLVIGGIVGTVLLVAAFIYVRRQS